MAADGMMIRQIAQSLFVSEGHDRDPSGSRLPEARHRQA
jgi:hypothetical protein